MVNGGRGVGKCEWWGRRLEAKCSASVTNYLSSEVHKQNTVGAGKLK